MADTQNAKPTRRCPICKADAVEAFMPFCSKRCADVDLGKWFTSSYVVPGPIESDEDDVLRPDEPPEKT